MNQNETIIKKVKEIVYRYDSMPILFFSAAGQGAIMMKKVIGIF